MMEDNFEWCGYNWSAKMEGGRIVHSRYPWYWYSSDVISDNGDGSLSLGIRENPREVVNYDGKVYHPTLEAATMRSKQVFSYGTFSCEIMVPECENLSASFWLSGDGNWPPEIDIEEGWTDKRSWFRMTEPYFPWIKPGWRTTSNVHYRDDEMEHVHIGSRNVCWFRQMRNPAKHFVKYACDWYPDEIVFYVDGKVVRRVGEDVCRKLTTNITDPDKGYDMKVIFNVWSDNPDISRNKLYTPMKIRNFEYEPMSRQ